VRDFLARLFRAIDSNFAGLVRGLSNIHCGKLCVVAGHIKNTLGPIGALHGDGLATFADVGNRAFDGPVSLLHEEA
jgi:hypothetical protein